MARALMPLEGKPLSFPHGFQNALALRQKASAEVGQLDTLTATVKQGRLHLAFKRHHRGGQRLLGDEGALRRCRERASLCRQNEILNLPHIHRCSPFPCPHHTPKRLVNRFPARKRADAAQTAPARGEAIAIGAGSQIAPSGRAQTNCRQDNPDS